MLVMKIEIVSKLQDKPSVPYQIKGYSYSELERYYQFQSRFPVRPLIEIKNGNEL